jgi:hypothetical protein
VLLAIVTPLRIRRTMPVPVLFTTICPLVSEPEKR